MTRLALGAETDLVVVNRPANPGADRVVLTSDRGKFWLGGDSPFWPDKDLLVCGRAKITFWPNQFKGELVGWQTNALAVGLDPNQQTMVVGWLDWLNRRLEITPVSLNPGPDDESGQFWQLLDSAWRLLRDRQIPELAGSYFYLRAFELSGQSFQLTESTNRQPLTGERFRFNADQCCFDPTPSGCYNQGHIKLLRCLTAVDPSLIARLTTPRQLLVDVWQLVRSHPGYVV